MGSKDTADTQTRRRQTRTQDGDGDDDDDDEDEEDEDEDENEDQTHTDAHTGDGWRWLRPGTSSFSNIRSSSSSGNSTLAGNVWPRLRASTLHRLEISSASL